MFQELVSPKTESGDPGGEKMAIHIYTIWWTSWIVDAGLC